MATMGELKDALKDVLDKRGTLGEIKAKIRSEVFHAIDDSQGVPLAEVSEENQIINELIKEYLTFNNYRNTLSVMIPEAGMASNAKRTRSDIVSRLDLKETHESRKLPLLYSLFSV